MFTYAKKLRTLDAEDEAFLALYRPVVDEVMLEEPMNWNGDVKEDLRAKSFSVGQLGEVAGPPPDKACSYLFTTMNITASGEVVACCVDWNHKTYLGNVKEETLQEIWQGERLKRLRRIHLAGQRGILEGCRHCERMPFAPEDDLKGVPLSVLG